MNTGQNDIRQGAARVLSSIRETRPLVLSLTNSVVQPITANMLLAVGAAPVMLCDAEEAAELLGAGCSALLLNVGTLSRAQEPAMRSAARAAREHGVPWVLDPVAAGLLRYRTDFCAELLELHPTLIRGNASEILAMAGEGNAGRGTDSTAGSADAVPAAQKLARKFGAAVLVTGEVDYATDGETVEAIHGGHPLMTRVTGVGCAMGALSAACLACAETPLQAAVATACILGDAGAAAAARAPHPGSFAVALLDVLDSLWK